MKNSKRVSVTRYVCLHACTFRELTMSENWENGRSWFSSLDFSQSMSPLRTSARKLRTKTYLSPPSSMYVTLNIYNTHNNGEITCMLNVNIQWNPENTFTALHCILYFVYSMARQTSSCTYALRSVFIMSSKIELMHPSGVSE